MRSKKAAANAAMSIFYEILTLVLGLMVPKLVISIYGSEIYGLSSTVNQMLTILGLMQAGAVGASIYQMYEPVAKKDYRQEEIVLDSSRRYFNKMGMVFAALVIITGPVFSYTRQSEKINFQELLIAFALLGINAAAYFFQLAWYDILFSSNQQRYILSVGCIAERIIYYALLFVIIHFRLNFLLMYVTAVFATAVKIAYYYSVYYRNYRRLIRRRIDDNHFKVRNRGYLLFSQIALQVMEGIPAIVIAYMYDLAYTAVYAVYYLVQSMIKMVVRIIQNSAAEMFGNVVFTENTNKVRETYEFLEFIFFVINSFLCTNTAALFLPFIYVYTDGNSLDQNYIFPALAVLIVVNNLAFGLFTPIHMLVSVKGLFKETYLQTVLGAVTGCIISVILGRVSWSFVTIGPIIFYFSMFVQRCFLIRRNVEWYRFSVTIRRTAVLLFLTFLFGMAGVLLFRGEYFLSWIWWLKTAIVSSLFSIVCISVYLIFFERDHISRLKNYMKTMIKGFNHV